VVERIVTQRQWKKATEFIFCGCFSYHLKGACHIWKKETKKEQLAAQQNLDEINAKREPKYRARWEADQAAKDLLSLQQGRRRKGRRPEWKFTKKTGKLVRDGKRGGIDWYHYLHKVVVPKLYPFFCRCKDLRPNTLVQKDGAEPHTHGVLHTYYSALGIQQLLWPGNSPDLNPIEPCWMYMKQETTRDGAHLTRAEAERRWLKVWNEMPQEKPQR
jgi:hypothetical protein